MIPPLSTSTIDANPLFAKLWKHVTSEVLEIDASRKSENELRARLSIVPEGSTPETECQDVDGHEGRRKSNDPKTSFENELREFRARSMRLEILRSMLKDVAYHVEENGESQTRIPFPSRQRTTRLENEDNDEGISQQSIPSASAKVADQEHSISSETRDLLLLTTAYLDLSTETNATKQLTSEDEKLLVDEIARFKADIPTISAAVGTRLLELESSLTGLAHLAGLEGYPSPSTQLLYNPGSDQTTSLISALTPQTTHLSHLRGTTLPNSLATLTKKLHTLLKSQAQQLQSSLLQLESSKHGVQSRHAQSRASFLATVAATMDLKTRVLVLEKRRILEAGGEENREWVRTKLDVLTDQELELEDRFVEFDRVLAEYEAVDPELRVMKALGSRYREVEREVERVKRDIERLEKGEHRL
jgi:diphthamide biosynthesis protein 3